MVLLTLTFLLGDMLLQTRAQLPGKYFIYVLIVLCLSLIYFIRHRKYLVTSLCAFICGYVWTAWYAHHVLSWALPKSAEGIPVTVTGFISALPRQNHWVTSFIFSCEELQWLDKKMIGKTKLRLSCQQCPSLQVGDKWQFVVKLKRIHGLANPGSFDYEAYSVQQGVRAAGYIVTSSKNILLSHHWWYPLNQLRQHLQHQLEAIMPNSPTAPWLMALTIGEKHGIAAQDWDVLRKTGTNHLMAIAGLHIGIIAGFAHFLVARLWRAMPALMLYLPAQLAGATAALGTAIVYSALAGFSIPTQRACLMLAVFIITLLTRRKINAWHAWSLALMIVLLLNPLSVLSESFWLSFGTLSLIIYGMSGRLAPQGLWWKWGRVQWVIGIGLMPLCLYFFQECSLISFIANTIAIPWLGFIILPLCFISALTVVVTPTIATYALWIADKSLAALWMMLSWFAHLQLSAFHIYMPNYFLLLTTIIAMILLLIPSGMPGRWFGIIWLLPLFNYQPAMPKIGEIWLTVLDVGQGLSVIIETQNHTLVYDTGPKLSEAFDMGASVVVPYLRTRAVKKVDMLVVSHGDNDHSGGANALMDAFPVVNIKTSAIEKLKKLLGSNTPQSISYCLANEHWYWDGINFTFLYPSHHYLNLGNDSSCVLRIDNGSQSVLLTGDIEKFAEKMLVKRRFNQLAATTILIAPHHGSKTSGYPDFVRMVGPQFVIYAIGYRNRYHFPHPSIVRLYHDLKVRQLNTADAGAIQFKLFNSDIELKPNLYRINHRQYWHDNP